MKNKNSKNNTVSSRNKKLMLVAFAAVLLISAALLYTRKQSQNTAGTAETPQPTETINLEPATEEDKLRAEQNKQAIVERERQLEEQPPTSGKKEVKPVITYAGQYGPRVEVGGYIPGIFEDGGTCTATFSQGSATFSKSVNAIKGASSVDCPVIEATTGEFSTKGTWTVILAYNSASAAGSSEPKQVEVK
ncbi:MAG: hypothetical protein V4702_05780 [Patescibacteria group bacterium]